MLNIFEFLRGLRLKAKSGTSEADEVGELEVLSSDSKLRYYNGTSSSPVVTEAHAATLTNKTIDADNNTISDLEVDNLKAGVLNTSTTMSGASDTQVPSALAIKTYVDNGDSGVQEDVDDLIALSGVAANSTNLGTFTGSTIPDNSTNKQAFQALETAGETTSTNLSAHTGASSGVHGVTGSVVGTSDSQTLTNKTIDADSNTITNIENADIKAGAAIAVNKLAALTASRAVVTDGSGFVSAATTTATEIGYVNGVTSAIQTQIDAKAAGAASSTDNAIARFDSTTGKVLQNSGVTIDDSNVVSGATQLNVDDLRLDGSTLSNTNAGAVTITGTNVNLNGNTILQSNKYIAYSNSDNTATGANATVTPASKNVRLTDSSLTSIDMITADAFGKSVTFINRTGNEVTINNDTGATAAYRIYTGTGAAVTLANNAAMDFVYDGTTERWNIVGGTGSGGGQSLDTIFQLTGSEIGQWSSGNNATFLGGGTLAGTFAADSSTPLQGIQSYLYTQASGSLNDYLASPAQAVDVRFRGQEVTFYMPVLYDGDSTDIQWLFYDETNAELIPSSVFIPVSTGMSNIFKTNIVIPLTCESIRVGFQVTVENDGAIFEFDSLQMTSDSTSYADIEYGVIGEILTSASTTTPPNFLFCDGSAVSRTTYSDLFAAIGTIYGTGDGSSTFNLPDYRGKFLRGTIDFTSTTGSGSAASNNATFTSHGINRTGFRVRLSSGTLTGLSTSTDYFAIVVDENTLAFATTYTNAIAGTKIAISGVNSAVIVQWEDPSASSRTGTVGGNSAENVGSLQDDAFQGHGHQLETFSGSAVNSIQWYGDHGGDSGVTAGGTSALAGDLEVLNAKQSSGFSTPRTADETRVKNLYVNYYIRYAKSSPSGILTAPETFSTDTAPLTYAGSSSYTLSTLANAPVGTFITYTVASGGNTRTQTNAAAPTQSTSDMATNGINLFTRAYNANSTSGSPAVIAIQIGKGMKGVTCDLYKSTGKTTSGSLDYIINGTTVEVGALYKDYNEQTGILLIDAGQNVNSTTTSHVFVFSDQTSQTNGYVVINASKNPALTGLNINRVYLEAASNAGEVITVDVTNIPFIAVEDTHGAWDGDQYTIPETGVYQITGHTFWSGASAQRVHTLYSNAALVTRMSEVVTANNHQFAATKYFTKGEVISIRATVNAGTLSASSTIHFLTITKVTVG
jgi:microcystin-dependent protein